MAKSQELGIAPEILLSPDVLRRVCFRPEADVADQLQQLGARQWQIELLVNEIASALKTLAD
jgi:ribonuclease D